MNRDFKGIWIPKEIWLNEDLTLQEKVMLAEIDSLDGEDGCYATNEYFSEMFNISKVRVSEIISSLVEKGMVESHIDKVNGNARTIKTLLKKTLIPYTEKVYDPIKENFNTLLKKSLTHNKEERIIEKKEESEAYAKSLWSKKPEFEQYWSKYRDYRKREGKGWFKSVVTEIESLNALHKKCNGDALVAQEAIAESITNRYTGIFPEKILKRFQQAANQSKTTIKPFAK